MTYRFFGKKTGSVYPYKTDNQNLKKKIENIDKKGHQIKWLSGCSNFEYKN